jgi:hypothetical protein
MKPPLFLFSSKDLISITFLLSKKLDFFKICRITHQLQYRILDLGF